MTRPRMVIAGGGPVGLALAAASGTFDVRVLEASAARPADGPEAFDVRVYALSPGSRDLLRELGAWERLDARRVAPVRRMEIFGDEGARLSFSARPGSALAWIVEAARLARSLEEQVGTLDNVQVTHEAVASSFGAQASAAWVMLEGGERIEGDLLVGADGPDSKVRSALSIPSEEAPYGESAVVANFETEVEHESVARQWFRDDGVLAWLPLPGRRISIVWSTASARAEEIAALDERSLERRVRDAGGGVLGDLRLISSVARFALRSIHVAEPVAPGVALVGDAAHAVHPLAGQGVNLGFQDARCLAETLEQRSGVERPGDMRVLRRYSRGRREDVTAMHFVTDRLDRLFASGTPGARRLRNLGLKLVDSQDWAKSALANRAMR
ncbi:MAG TPA: FAD-dependent monooxygenase [Usitatibacter sp.]|nr:FAD-dependent monooxygenase [Usitatibacter sp.]